MLPKNNMFTPAVDFVDDRWSASPDFAAILVQVIQDNRPSMIVDLGGGFTSIVAGYCVEELGKGRVIVFDHQEDFAEATRQQIVRHQLDEFVRVCHAPLTPATIGKTILDWYAPALFDDINDIDLLIVDGQQPLQIMRCRVAIQSLDASKTLAKPATHFSCPCHPSEDFDATAEVAP